MTANQKASSTTMLWLKQLTTSTFTSIDNKVAKIDFIHRNKKTILGLVVCWAVVVLGSYFMFDLAGDQKQNAFLSDGADQVSELADQCAPLLLEDDLLGLTRQVAEFAKQNAVVFAAVLNHENRVVAHTDPEKFNKPYEFLNNQQDIESINEVNIAVGQQADGTVLAAFSKTITYSGIKIGTAVYTIPEKRLSGILSRYQFYRLMVMIFTTLAFVVLLFVLDKKRRAKSVSSIPAETDASKIGPYQIREKIAQGGMAELFIADYVRQDGFKRLVAIKRVLPHLAENTDFINMFIREARLAALLQHPNIVQIFDFGKIQNTYIIAMEYIKGLNLGQIMAKLQKPLSIDMAVFIIMKISLGLDYSHKRKDDDTDQLLGIVHRDISPQNILISDQGEVKISDFGISKATTEPSLTQAGVIKGKLAYLAPEQALGQEVDQQADIYALGLVFYEILSGQRLYHFDSDIEAIRTIPEMIIPPLTTVRPDLPDGVERIVMKCLEKDKGQRYADAMALHDDLMQLKIKLNMAYDASDLSNFMRTTLNYA